MIEPMDASNNNPGEAITQALSRLLELGEKTMISPPTRRIRISVSTTSKGVKSYDCTIEVDSTVEEALQESDRLVAELDRRYPAPEAEDIT